MLIPRIKLVILTLVALFFQHPNSWLDFGQVAAITFIAYLVIKRGNKSGDQDITFWKDEMRKAVRDELERRFPTSPDTKKGPTDHPVRPFVPTSRW